MREELAYLIGVACALLVAVGVLASLQKSMLKILEIMCGAADCARFWVGFCQVFLILMTLIISYLGRTMGVGELPPLFPIVHYFISGLIGLIIALTAVGIVLAIGKPSQEPARKPDLMPEVQTTVLLKLRERVAEMRTDDVGDKSTPLSGSI